MPQGIGYAFDPSAGQQGRAGSDATGGGFSRMSPQQAVKLLSLRIPERSPGMGRGIAPQMLLQSPGSAATGAGGADPMQAVIQGLMRVMVPGLQSGEAPMGGGQGQGAPGQPQPQLPNWGSILQGFGARPPAPRVIPGLGEGGQKSSLPAAPAAPQAPYTGGPPPDWSGFMNQFNAGGSSLF